LFLNFLKNVDLDGLGFLFFGFVLFCLFVFYFVCFGETGFTQGFALTKQVLYHLSHTSCPFCSGYSGDGLSQTVCPG
jgi:hypothetical protein